MRSILLAAFVVSFAGSCSGGSGTHRANVPHTRWHLDVNGDHYDDLFTARQYDPVSIYAGGPTGLSSTPATSLAPDPSRFMEAFATAVANAGDVNGDGYGDVVVGAPATPVGPDMNPSNLPGAAYIYMGSAAGLSSTAAITLTQEGANTQFGIGVATAGDVDGDGFDDVIIRTRGPAYPTPIDGSGHAYVYRGSASGVTSLPAFVLPGVLRDAVGIGDVNGDGYDDVLISSASPSTDGSTVRGGELHLHLGGPGGPSSTPDQRIPIDFETYSLVRIGDVDGDSFDDALVDAGGNEIVVYRGSAAGLVAPPSTSIPIHHRDLLAAGDVDGDGFPDIVARIFPDPAGTNSTISLYRGSAHGLETSPAATIVPAGDTYFTRIVGSGDFNRDGLGDIAIGAGSGLTMERIDEYLAVRGGTFGTSPNAALTNP